MTKNGLANSNIWENDERFLWSNVQRVKLEMHRSGAGVSFSFQIMPHSERGFRRIPSNAQTDTNPPFGLTKLFAAKSCFAITLLKIKLISVNGWRFQVPRSHF